MFAEVRKLELGPGRMIPKPKDWDGQGEGKINTFLRVFNSNNTLEGWKCILQQYSAIYNAGIDQMHRNLVDRFNLVNKFIS